MAKRQSPPEDENPEAADDHPGATAFVRLDDAGKLPPPRSAPAPTSGAPKKGLQIQLPDDEPPPPPKPKVAPPPAKPKGRRGAWWNEKSAGEGEEEAPAEEAPPEEPPAEEAPEEPPADDAPGKTAFLSVEAPPPPPRRKAPARREEPEAAPPADDGRTQFFKPDQVVLAAEVRERPAPVPVESGVPWKQILLALGIAFLVIVLGLIFVFRKELFSPSGHRPARPVGVHGSADPGRQG